MSKYSDPLWQTNPVLAQIREALSEVEHIRAALKALEAKAMAFPGPLKQEPGFLHLGGLLNAVGLTRLDGWSKSLTESEIGLWTMLELDGHFARFFADQRKRFIDQQVLKWSAMKGAAKIGTRVADFVRELR
jgi:hypothetical protein